MHFKIHLYGMVRDSPTVHQVLEISTCILGTFNTLAFVEKIPQCMTQIHVLLEVQVSMSIDVNFSLVSNFKP